MVLTSIIGARPLIRHNIIRNGKDIGILMYLLINILLFYFSIDFKRHDGGRGAIEKNEIHHNAKCNIYVQQSGKPTIRKNKIHSSEIGYTASGEGVIGEIIANWIYNHESEGITLLLLLLLLLRLLLLLLLLLVLYTKLIIITRAWHFE